MRILLSLTLLALSCGGAAQTQLAGRWAAGGIDCVATLTIDGTPNTLTGNGSIGGDCVGTFAVSGTESAMVWTYADGRVQHYSVPMTFQDGFWARTNDPGAFDWDFNRVK
jgi:hypothetical protein